MKIGIVGSRTYTNYEKFVKILTAIGFDKEENVIISGGDKGADLLAKYFAEDSNLEYIEFKPEVSNDCNKWEWSKAAHKRNEKIVQASDIIVAFWDGESSDTENVIQTARQYKKTTFIFYI